MQYGFSLVEMLVTMFVVVLVTSLVTLSVTSDGEDIRFDAQVRSLARVSSYALDEAQMRGVDMGLLLQMVDDDGESRYRYSWMERRPEGWREPEEDIDIFRGQTFSPDIELYLELEDLVVTDLDIDPEKATPTPQVVFYASGETIAGAIEVHQKNSGEVLWRVEWDMLGRFSLMPRGEQVEEPLYGDIN
ncbi:MAG: type II transport protein [Halieaceae bacterium]|mgnify:FL=1|nr:type II transport protein [Halieaceae bacterium]